MKKYFFLFFFFIFSNNLYAETISSLTTRTSTTSVSEDLTVTSSGTLVCSNHTQCLDVTSRNTKITNHGNIYSTGSTTNQLIRARGASNGYEVEIYNYGTIDQKGNSTAIMIPNSEDDDSDSVGHYIYNSGQILNSSGTKFTIQYHESDFTKIDNYGDIKNTGSFITLYGEGDEYTTINNYHGATISANGSRAINTKAANAAKGLEPSKYLTINNWGTISAAYWTIELGEESTLNNYGNVLITDWSSSSDDAIIMLDDNNTVNLYDGTVISGDLNANSTSGSALNLHLCSSYYFYLEDTWDVTDKSECGELVHSGGYAQSVSPLFQSVADEIGAIRTDIINEVYDYAKDKIKEEEDFFLPIASHTKREKASAIDKFENNTSGFAFGFPAENEKIKGHLVFNLSKNKIDLLNQYIEDKTYQVGFFLEDLNFKAILGYHDYEGDRHRLNNTTTSGKDLLEQDFKSTSLIFGKQFYKKFEDNSYFKYNLDTNFEGYFNHDEEDHVKWNSRIIGQVMGDMTVGWKTLSTNKFYFNPELTFGYRTMITGKDQKYEFKGSNKTFRGGKKEDASVKFALLTHYSFNEKSKLFLDASAKKTQSNQETYLLNIGLKSSF